MLFISCTNDENMSEEVQPGMYTVEKIIHATTEKDQSRGISPTNEEFDLVYDPNYIYLHIVGNENTVKIPLYTTNCETNKECKCFRYNINVLPDGSAIVTPIIDDQGTLASTSLTIPPGSTCYFSSVEESVWKLKSNQIYPQDNSIFQSTPHILYVENQETNKEIYRSEENYSITNLTDDINGLLMGRACAGFTVMTLFYDGDKMNLSPAGGYITLTADEFNTIMGSNYNQWYMKIYIGGLPFISQYNFGTMTKENNSQYNYGYYSTGDFSSTFQNNKFKPFEEKSLGWGLHFLQTYGYYTPIDTRLLTPTLEDKLDVYILIKHWEGEGTPNEEWLASDQNALYTTLDISGVTNPRNGVFYIRGLLMDVRQFKNVWENAKTSTASRTDNGMHYFELKDAKVICESY
jgi:hypothetical protein